MRTERPAVRWFRCLALATTGLALVVVALGAYVRLSDAGLGCPDWPGCYGHIAVPGDSDAVDAANAAYPRRPVAAAKGWKEMIHRYLAGTLGLAVFGLAAWAWRTRRRRPAAWRLAATTAVLVVFQALLGMWTVTWKLKPLIVMAHLLGGLTVLSLLWLQALRAGAIPARWQLACTRRVRLALGLALAVLVCQIALGGWTSANYAALACNELPTCSLGEYWPNADFAAGFDPWHGIGPSYEYATHLDHPAKVAIHLAHRLGAVVTLLVMLAVAALLLHDGRGARSSATAAAALLAVLGVQWLLGMGNVALSLPLAVAVAHNANAALLLLVLITLGFLAIPRRSS